MSALNNLFVWLYFNCLTGFCALYYICQGGYVIAAIDLSLNKITWKVEKKNFFNEMFRKLKRQPSSSFSITDSCYFDNTLSILQFNKIDMLSEAK